MIIETAKYLFHHLKACFFNCFFKFLTIHFVIIENDFYSMFFVIRGYLLHTGNFFQSGTHFVCSARSSHPLYIEQSSMFSSKQNRRDCYYSKNQHASDNLHKNSFFFNSNNRITDKNPEKNKNTLFTV